MRQQNKNIRPESAKSILALRATLPTAAWRRRKAAGDASFTDAGIRATDEALGDFLKGLADHAKKKNATSVFGSVKRVVRALNAVNASHGQLIETMEREELGAFIHDAVRLTGLDPKGTDLTEEWREW